MCSSISAYMITNRQWNVANKDIHAFLTQRTGKTWKWNYWRRKIQYALLVKPGKILKRLCHVRFQKIIANCDFLHDSQSRFRSSFRLQSGVLDLGNRSSSSMSTSTSVATVSVDFRQVFDVSWVICCVLVLFVRLYHVWIFLLCPLCLHVCFACLLLSLFLGLHCSCFFYNDIFSCP